MRQARQRGRPDGVPPAGRGIPAVVSQHHAGPGPKLPLAAAGGPPAGDDRAGPRWRRGPERGRQQVVRGGVVLGEQEQAGDVAFGVTGLPGVGSTRHGSRAAAFGIPMMTVSLIGGG